MTADTQPRSEHSYKPRGSCKKIFTMRDGEIVLAGPAGTGKSRAMMEKLHLMALVNPGMRGLICRKTATSLSSTALVTWRRFIVNESLIAGDVAYFGGSGQEPAHYKYRNGSVIAICGLDNVSKIMSSEYDVIYVQEATELTENEWETLTTRLRFWSISFQQIMADCNPAQPTHWLKLRADTRRCKMLDSRHEDNPLLFDDEGNLTERGEDYLSKLDALTGVRYQRLRLGKWVAAEGIIYEDFSDIHVIDNIPVTADVEVDHAGVPLSWRRYWGVDFGFVHPFVLQCWAEDGDGRLYQYREIFQTHKTVDQHARTIMAIVAPGGNWIDGEYRGGVWKEPKPVSVVCDHDAEGRATLEKGIGLSTVPAHKAVLEGIEAVQVRMRDAGDGRPRIFLLRDAVVHKDPALSESGKPTCTLDEIPGYVWADKGKEAPVKIDDDGCDAMRYVVAERDYGIRAIYRSFTV